MNVGISGFRSQVGGQIKQAPSQIRQVAVQNARAQSNEFAKSAVAQVGVPMNEGNSVDLYSQLTGGDHGEVNVGEINQSEEALMGKLRNQLEQEMQRARSERLKASEAWSQQQSQLLAEPVHDDQSVIESHGKPKRGAGGRMKQVTNKSEVGRGAKN